MVEMSFIGSTCARGWHEANMIKARYQGNRILEGAG